MSEFFKCLFSLIGVISCIAVIIILIMLLVMTLKEKVEDRIHDYKVEHRFDKPPTAKCYCRDCMLWDSETGKCYDSCNSRYMGPAWFCCFAEPRGRKDIKGDK